MQTPEERTAKSLGGRIGANSRWAAAKDRVAATQPARDGLLGKFEREVDPDRTLDPIERAKRVDNALKAHMARMTLRSVQVRARRKTRKTQR
jgi:hypothetical protein